MNVCSTASRTSADPTLTLFCCCRSSRPSAYKVLMGIHKERATETTKQERRLEKIVQGPAGVDIALLKLDRSDQRRRFRERKDCCCSAEILRRISFPKLVHTVLRKPQILGLNRFFSSGCSIWLKCCLQFGFCCPELFLCTDLQTSMTKCCPPVCLRRTTPSPETLAAM